MITDRYGGEGGAPCEVRVKGQLLPVFNNIRVNLLTIFFYWSCIGGQSLSLAAVHY